MDEINPLRIIEDECVSDKNNFSKNDDDKESQRISLMIVEDKDFMMNTDNHLHSKLSLQIDDSCIGDENSLILNTNNNHNDTSTIIKIGSYKSELDDDNDDDDDFGDKQSTNNNESIVNLLGQINDIVG